MVFLPVTAFTSFTLAIVLLFIGKDVTQRIAVLRRYSIPEAVIGGLLCIVVICALYYGAGVVVEFELGVRDILLLYFFAAIGLGSDVRTVRRGGRPLLILLALAVAWSCRTWPGWPSPGASEWTRAWA